MLNYVNSFLTQIVLFVLLQIECIVLLCSVMLMVVAKGVTKCISVRYLGGAGESKTMENCVT